MKRRHHIIAPNTKDIARKLHTTDARRYQKYDVIFEELESLDYDLRIQIVPLAYIASWASGYINLKDDIYTYTSRPRTNPQEKRS
jgi:hypothetical protein